MKKFIPFPFWIAFLCMVIICKETYCQEIPPQNKDQILDIKMELLDTKLQLLDEKLEHLATDPKYSKTKTERKENIYQKDTFTKSYKSAIKLNPARLFEGTFQISWEKYLSKHYAIDVSALGTYVTKSSIGGRYFSSQSAMYAYNSNSESYEYFTSKMISGWGVIVQLKNYLVSNNNSDIKTHVGLYAAPQIMYRKIWLEGSRDYWVFYENNEKEIVQILDVVSGGVIIGAKIPLMHILCLDIFGGGVMRMSKYSAEPDFSKYKKWYNIDYSGVLPTLGLQIGILK